MSSGPRSGSEQGNALLRDVINHLHKESRAAPDWAGSLRTYGWMWGLPIAAILISLLIDVQYRTVVWTVALLVMGTACVLNARRCGRTHCRFTGPYYVAMVLPVLVLGLGVVSAGLAVWIALAVLIIGGSKIVWWATERAWGRYS